MKSRKTILQTALIHLSLMRKTRRVPLGVAFVVATLFVLAVSAPQNGGAQTNSQAPSATDWKSVEQALGKAGSLQGAAARDRRARFVDLRSHRMLSLCIRPV